MSSSDILDAKVVDNQSEGYWSCGVRLQRRCVTARLVSVLFQVGFEAVVCNFSGLLEAWHSLADFNIYPAIYGHFCSSYCVIISSGIMSRLMRTYLYSSTVMGVPE